MTIALSSLRVGAEVDASKYTAGMAAKVAADKQGAASSIAVGEAIAVANTKISKSGDILSSLRRQYVDGAANAQKFESAINALGRGVERGAVPLNEVSQILDGIYRKYQLTADSASLVERGQTELAGAVEALNTKVAEQRSGVDELTASYKRMAAEARAAFDAEHAQSTFNEQLGVRSASSGSASASAAAFSEILDRQDEIARLRAAQQGQNFSSDINQMFGIGGSGASARESASVFEQAAREADELARKVTNLRAQLDPVGASQANLNAQLAEYAKLADMGQISTLELAQAQDLARDKHDQLVKSLDKQGGSKNNFQTTNVAYQLQDIFSTAALGMSPMTVALQQGPQLASVFGETGAAGAVKTLGTAFLSLVSPVSLATIGLTGLTAAAIQYFTSTKSESAKVADAIKNHSALIARIKDAWPQATAAIRQYSAESKAILTQDTKDAVELYKKQIAESSKAAAYSLSGITRRSRASGDPIVDQLTQASNDLMAGVKAGDPPLRQFVERLIEIENQKGAPKNIKDVVDQAREAAKAGLDAQGKLSPLIDTIHGVGAAAAAEVKRIDAFTTAINNLAGVAPTPLTDSEKLQQLYETTVNRASTREQKDDALSAYEAAQKRLSDQNPLVVNSDGRLTPVPTPQGRPNRELGYDGDGSEKLAKAGQSAKNAYRDVIKSANDRIQQMQLETQTAGQTGIAAETLSFKLKLLQDATDKGRTVTAAQRAEIDKLAESYKAAATAASVAKLQQDIAFQQRQLGRSSLDQTVASTLQQYGLPQDLNSTYAQLIRSNEQLKTARDLAGDFASTLANGLRQGEGLWKSFGDAATSVLTKISDMLLNDVLNSLFRVNNAASSSGGGLLGSLGSLLGLGGSSQFAAAQAGTLAPGLFANGGAFSGGVRAFAGGGIFSNSIVSRPTLFPFANGTGLMGEAGPEAIMPLRRDASGRLGVSSPGNDNRSSGSSGLGGLHVSVGVAFDQDEGFRAYVKDVAQTESSSTFQSGIQQYDDQMPDRVAQINLNPRRR